MSPECHARITKSAGHTTETVPQNGLSGMGTNYRAGLPLNELKGRETYDKPIIFTGQQTSRGFWNGVTFTNSANPLNALEYVTVEYAGAKEMLDASASAFRAAVSLESSGYDVKAKLTHCTIRESSGYGLYLSQIATLLDCTNNTFTHNATGAVRAYSTSTHNLSASSSYSGNDLDLVYVISNYGWIDHGGVLWEERTQDSWPSFLN